jgi:hypothetical protein
MKIVERSQSIQLVGGGKYNVGYMDAARNLLAVAQKNPARGERGSSEWGKLPA